MSSTKRKTSEKEIGHGKVETISRLAQWSAGGLDSLGPWSSQSTAGWSHCCSDPFKIGIWEWSFAIAKKENNKEVQYGLLFKSPLVSKEHPLVSKFMFRVFYSAPRHSPTNFFYDKEFQPNRCIWLHKSIPQSSFICDVEFRNLKISTEGLVQSPLPDTNMICLSRMFSEQIHTDITINTPGGALKAHRAILSANSPVFKSMFSHDLKENQTSVVDIEDMSLESCTLMLNYMYGNIEQEELVKNHLLLLVAADKYEITGLKNYCEEGLIEDMNYDTVLARLQVARMYQLDKLKKVCFKYLFDFGMIYEVKLRMESFSDHEDKEELMLEMLQAIVTTRRPTYN